MTSAPARFKGDLRQGQLSFLDVVAQAVGTIAPSGSPALVIPVVFASAGNGTWLAYFFATLALLLLSVNINVFASRSASPGALYAFAGQGLGPFWGIVSGWSLLIAYVFTAAAVVAGSVNYCLVVLRLLFGDLDEVVASVLLSLLLVTSAWYIGWRSIRLSTRLSLALEGITIVAILAVLIAYFFRGGHLIDQPQITLAGLTLDNVRLGLVLAFFSFVGFESATVLGHEARDPLRVIPRSVITTVLATGLFFVLSSYALVAAFQGVEPGFAKVDAPVSLLAATVGLGILGPVISAGVAASFFASALASINAAARVVFALSRHGILHGKAGDAHETHATPHVAVSVVAAVVLAFSLSLTVRGVGLLDAFGYFGSVATFGFLVSYVLVSIGAPVFLKRRGELKSRHIAIAIASVALLLLPLFGVLYPVPPYPQNLLPYVFAALLAAGTGYFLYVSRKLPDALKLIEADLGNVSGEPLAQRSA